MARNEPFEFTLFDLAKVIVLIGLLSGVMMIGINMTRSAKIRDFAASISRMDTAAMTFRLKYQSVPGDLSPGKAAENGFVARSGYPGRGDNNGLIEFCNPTLIGLGCETTLYWRDLAQADLIGKNTITLATDDVVDGSGVGFNLANYLPKVAFRDRLYYFMYPLAGHNAYYIGIIPFVDAVGGFTPVSGLTAHEADGIDEKMDDGTPAHGNVQAMKTPLVVDPGAPDTQGCVAVSNNGETSYNRHNNTACQLSIRSGL